MAKKKPTKRKKTVRENPERQIRIVDFHGHDGVPCEQAEMPWDDADLGTYSNGQHFCGECGEAVSPIVKYNVEAEIYFAILFLRSMRTDAKKLQLQGNKAAGRRVRKDAMAVTQRMSKIRKMVLSLCSEISEQSKGGSDV